jgi:hypothetical protein
MALKPGDGLDKWEIAVAKKVVGEFRRRSRILGREEFDDLVQDCLLHWIGVRRKLAPIRTSHLWATWRRSCATSSPT